MALKVSVDEQGAVSASVHYCELVSKSASAAWSALGLRMRLRSLPE